MKKLLMIALLVGAIPAVAFSQSVTCDACTHVASVYIGEGGFIATADNADEVAWVASCDGVTRTGTEPADDDGVVRGLWTGDLACMADDGEFKIGPVLDGGWFWVTDDSNSAVGNLVSMDILANTPVDVTEAGDNVEMMKGMGAVYLKETSTGRVGILPNILAEPPTAALRACGYNDNTAAAGNSRFTVRNSDCALGDGGTKIRALGAVDPYTGMPTDGTMVRRPLTGTDPAVVTVDLWGNGTGHFNPTGAPTGSATSSGTTDPRLGHALQPLALGGDDATTGGFQAHIGGIGTTRILTTPPNYTADPVVYANGGATFEVATGTSVGTLSIYADPRYCNPTAKPPVNESETFTISAYVATGAAAEDQVTPRIATAGNAANRLAAQTQITVVCPSGSSSSHQGQELVPENPFPTDR